MPWRAARFTLVTSEHILGELARTFNQPYFSNHLTAEQRAKNIALLRAEAAIMPLTIVVHGVATHPEDDLVVATALSARADYLVTGDRQLRALSPFRGVVVCTPREFLDFLAE